VTGVDQSAIRPNDLELPPTEGEADVTAVRRVHNASALDLSRRDRELRFELTVDQSNVSFRAVVAVRQTPELRDLSAFVNAQVVEYKAAGPCRELAA